MRLNINGQCKARRFQTLEQCKAETVRLLIEQGSDVTAKDEGLSTPLHLASSSGFPEIMRLLIDHGADVTSRDESRRTPLHLASSWVSAQAALSFSHRLHVNGQFGDYYEVPPDPSWVRLLLDHGADVAAQDATHLTPLHLAAFWGNVETVWLLMGHGADITAIDKNNKTPLHFASSKVSSLTAPLIV